MFSSHHQNLFCWKCAHAAVGVYESYFSRKKSVFEAWERQGKRISVFKVTDKDNLLTLNEAAENSGLMSCLIRDAGRTQIPRGSLTVLAVGPALKSELEWLTKNILPYTWNVNCLNCKGTVSVSYPKKMRRSFEIPFDKLLCSGLVLNMIVACISQKCYKSLKSLLTALKLKKKYRLNWILRILKFQKISSRKLSFEFLL